MYSAIALFLIVFLFPETVNHAYISLVTRLLSIFKNILDLQNDLFLGLKDDTKINKLLGMREAMFDLLRGCMSRFTSI